MFEDTLKEAKVKEDEKTEPDDDDEDVE